MKKSDSIKHQHIYFDIDAAFREELIYNNLFNSFANLSNNIYYIFDYTRNKIIYPHKIIQFLKHKFLLMDQGSLFFQKSVHPEDLNWLIKFNKTVFNYFHTLKKEKRKYVSVICDIRLKDIDNEYILVNHHSAPLSFTPDGEIGKILCVISHSCNQKSGNAYLMHSDMKKKLNII